MLSAPSSSSSSSTDLIQQILTTTTTSSAPPSTSHPSSASSSAPSLSLATPSSSSSSSSASAVQVAQQQQQQQSNNNTTAVDTTNQTPLPQLLCKSTSSREEVQVLDEDEPETKRRKPNSAGQAQTEKLESRLNGILCCAVCLDLPKMAIYQVGKQEQEPRNHSSFFISLIEIHHPRVANRLDSFVSSVLSGWLGSPV